MVERLSLLFDFEDKNQFKQRVQICKFYKQRAEDEKNFQEYAVTIPDSNVSQLREEWIKNIQDKAWIKKKKYSDFDLGWANQITANIIETVKAEYNREMKKCYVLAEMKDKVNNQKFKDMRIQVRSHVDTVPFYGTIDKLDYEKLNFGQLSEKLAQNHSTKQKEIVEALRMFSERNSQYMTKDLLVFNLSTSDLPYKLSSFMNMQSSAHNKNLQSLHIQWREFISNDISEKLRKIELYNPSIPSKEEYMDSKRMPMRRFLRRVDLIFRESVKTLAEYNINEWIKTCRQFVMDNFEDRTKEVWRVSEKPMIYVEIKTKERNKDRKKRESDEELIFFEPNDATINKKLKEPLQWLIKAINSFNTLEPNIVNMVNLPQKVAFQVDEKMPMFAEAFERLDQLIEEGLKRPNEILEKFQKYAFLLHKPAEDVVKSYWGKDSENKKSVTDLDEYLNKVSESINEIEGLAINEMNCHFFQIRTKSVKATLIKSAKEIMKALMAKINSSSSKTVQEIQEKYDSLITKMTTEPQSEEKLVEMQGVIRSEERRVGKEC